jgi:hypothetical protein
MPFGLPNMTDAQLLVGLVGQHMTEDGATL